MSGTNSDLEYSDLNGYTIITSNVYKENIDKVLLMSKLTNDVQVCQCLPSEMCAQFCQNRDMFFECTLGHCPCGEKCVNQRIQKGLRTLVTRFATHEKGYGVKATTAIKKGTIIIEYIGEVITETTYKSRILTLYRDNLHSYCMQLHGEFVIDAHQKGNLSRFINHGCSPNCHIEKWVVDKLPRLVIVASEDIDIGEELLYDYNFFLYNPHGAARCSCGSFLCRKIIGKVLSLNFNEIISSFYIFSIFSSISSISLRKSHFQVQKYPRWVVKNVLKILLVK